MTDFKELKAGSGSVDVDDFNAIVDEVQSLADAGGGGGSLPAWWVVDSTPGAENVSFNSTSAATDYNDLFRLAVAEGDIFFVDTAGDADWYFRDSGTAFDFKRTSDNLQVVRIKDTGLIVGSGTSQGLFSVDVDQNSVTVANNALDNTILDIRKATDAIGFFGAVATPRPTGVAVTAAGIHAALVTLGLIAA